MPVDSWKLLEWARLDPIGPAVWLRFDAQLAACIRKIGRIPKVYRYNPKPFRSVRINNFPYRIYFIEEQHEIVVHVVADLRRDPMKLSARLRLN